MGEFHDHRFPNESDEYRAARDRLLEAEVALRKQVAEVAKLRRGLPAGGLLKEDYVFAEGADGLADAEEVKSTRLSELFREGRDSLVVYSFMFAPDDETPCPMCTSFLDGINGTVRHAREKINFAVVAKAPVAKIRNWALERDWRYLRLLSSFGNTYNSDYFAESAQGDQWPAVNVFQRTPSGIRHFYNAELFYAPTEPDQHPRHVDMIWPLWNLFDLTPEGRAADWYPKTRYD